MEIGQCRRRAFQQKHQNEHVNKLRRREQFKPPSRRTCTHCTLKSSQRPHHPLRARRILADAPAQQAPQHEDGGTDDGEEGCQGDVGVREEQTAPSVVPHEKLGAQAHQDRQHLASERPHEGETRQRANRSRAKLIPFFFSLRLVHRLVANLVILLQLGFFVCCCCCWIVLRSGIKS